jgi:recombination protein U
MDRKKTGKKSKESGALFESLIGAACLRYSERGLAEIQKTPEPMRPLSKPDTKGRFMACYLKQAQPDFKGTLAGGRAIVIEAKHTAADRIRKTAVSVEQDRSLTRHDMLGAACYVLVSFGFKCYRMIPWSTWSDMRRRFGRAYLTPEDIPECEVDIRDGWLHFLDTIEGIEPVSWLQEMGPAGDAPVSV